MEDESLDLRYVATEAGEMQLHVWAEDLPRIPRQIGRGLTGRSEPAVFERLRNGRRCDGR